MNFKSRTYTYVLITIIILCIFSSIGWLVRLDLIVEKYLSDFNKFELLLSQISNTLIVLSLTSVLSTNFGQVYWVDVRELKLIIPFFSCFTGITVYLMTGLVFSIISYVMLFYVGMLVSFVFSTLLLVVLTFKMISIYFGKENIKRQMNFEYQKKMVLGNAAYVSDYLRGLERFEQRCEKDDFPDKRKFILMLKKEINGIKNLLDSKDQDYVDKAHNEHINKYLYEQRKLKDIDEKIEEYTRKAISINNYDVVHENIELLVESENYNTFINLIEDLFDWDEKYTCSMLKKISDKKD